MDSFWFWVGLTWDVLVAWFETLPAWVQVTALLALVCMALWLAWMVVYGIWRVVGWLRGIRKPRLTLAEAQEQRAANESPLSEAEQWALGESEVVE